jgi:hypothetical protein
MLPASTSFAPYVHGNRRKSQCGSYSTKSEESIPDTRSNEPVGDVERQAHAEYLGHKAEERESFSGNLSVSIDKVGGDRSRGQLNAKVD